MLKCGIRLRKGVNTTKRTYSIVTNYENVYKKICIQTILAFNLHKKSNKNYACNEN